MIFPAINLHLSGIFDGYVSHNQMVSVVFFCGFWSHSDRQIRGFSSDASPGFRKRSSIRFVTWGRGKSQGKTRETRTVFLIWGSHPKKISLNILGISNCLCKSYNHQKNIQRRSLFSPYIPSGKRLHNYGKSPFFIGKSTISTGQFSIAMLVYQRVSY